MITKEKRKNSNNNSEDLIDSKKQKKDIIENELQDMSLKVSYAVKDGLRHLSPYWTAYKTFTKRRWIGRTFLDVFTEEFLSVNKHYAKVACKLGRIFINGVQMTNPNYILKENERILHIGHRHEHPILDTDIEIIENTDNYVVINKPASMPVHACGQYKANTVLARLEKEKNITGLRVVHRLDRVTSGVLIFAKNYDTDVEMKRSLEAKDWKKEYICRVVGEFPQEEIECTEPLGVLSPSMGIQCVRFDGKSSKSVFRGLWTDGNESLVLCKIHTGRTHQIRVHLQWLGHPIISDTVYNTEEWGPYKGKNGEYGKSLEQLRLDVQNAHRVTSWKEEIDPEYERRMEKMYNDPEVIPENPNIDFESRPSYDSICLGCHVVNKKPSENHMRLHLHCWKYETPKGTFIASLPDWANEAEEFLVC